MSHEPLPIPVVNVPYENQEAAEGLQFFARGCVALDGEAPEAEEMADPFQQFLADARLAGTAGGFSNVERFDAESQARRAQVAGVYKKIADGVLSGPAPQTFGKRASEPRVEEEVHADGSKTVTEVFDSGARCRKIYDAAGALLSTAVLA